MIKETVPREEAYQKSLDLLNKCSSPHGFLASLSGRDNYRRVWGRDSMICSLAALITEKHFLIKQVKKSLLTLMKFQYKHGQIPSNVDVINKKISYGKSAGRVDATLWFLVGFGQYLKRTKDYKFLHKYYKNFKKALELNHLYEFNEKGLIYVPKGGDWADEYIQEGYILYDQLLYYQAMKEFVFIRKKLHKRTEKLVRKIECLKKQLLVNFWLEKSNKNSAYIYHQILFDKYINKKKYRQPYLLPCFSPSGYGFRFDGFANSLALNLNILPNRKENLIHGYINKNFAAKSNYLLPAFHPVITPSDYGWVALQNSYSIKFRNNPHSYHNGGLWPMITGFYAAALAKEDKNKAFQYLDGINTANSKSKNSSSWGFYEFLNGKTFRPGGPKYQAWSAAASILAYETIVNKKKVFI